MPASEFSQQRLAQRAGTEVIAWYRLPNVEHEELATLSKSDKSALEVISGLAIQCTINTINTLCNMRLEDTYRFNSLINQDTDRGRRLRWTALENMLSSQNEGDERVRMARRALLNTQILLGRELSAHVARLPLAPEVVLPHLAGLYVPSPDVFISPEYIWLPDTAKNMPGGTATDGAFRSIASFSPDPPAPRANRPIVCRPTQ